MQSNQMERMHMWSSFKILIEDLRLTSNVAVTVTKNRKLLSKNMLATISLKVDHICIISIKFGGNWLFTGF
jgi:carbonic anhydrase